MLGPVTLKFSPLGPPAEAAETAGGPVPMGAQPAGLLLGLKAARPAAIESAKHNLSRPRCPKAYALAPYESTSSTRFDADGAKHETLGERLGSRSCRRAKTVIWHGFEAF